MIQTYEDNPSRESGHFILVPSDIVEKGEAHDRGSLHLSTHLLILDGIKVCCRKRGDDEFRYAGLWTTTIGTHVELGDDYRETLIKQFGFPLDLQWQGEFRVRDPYENEVNGLHIAHVKESSLPKDFMEERRYIPFDELEELIRGDKTTPHLRNAYLFLRGEL
jgi:hypothetical protein